MDQSRRQFLLSAACVPALMRAQGGAALSDSAATLIEQAYRLWGQLGSQVWPGWTGDPPPFIYVDSEWEYGLHFPKELKGASAMAARPGVQIRPRTFAPDITATMDVDGETAVVFGTPPATNRNAARWQLTLQHEFFHVFQAANHETEKVRALGLGPENDGSWQLNFPFPYSDPEVMRLIHLQSYMAYIGISAQSDEDAQYAAGSALDAAHVYRAYLKKIDPTERCYRYSQFQEWAEGVAFFVEYQMAKLAAASGDEYRRAWESDYSRRIFLVKHAGRAAKSRTAFYHLGMGKALLLDRLKPAWKQEYFRKDVWMDDLLEKALATE